MNTQQKTTLIHNGTTQQGIDLIKKLLCENNLTTNDIKNRILCVDKPENVYKIQEFLGFDEFIFYPLGKNVNLDIKANIDSVFICSGKGEK